MSGARQSFTADHSGFSMFADRGDWDRSPGMDGSRIAPIASGVYNSAGSSRSNRNSVVAPKWRRRYDRAIIIISGIAVTAGSIVTAVEWLRG